jgi:hypothetical protein
VQHLFAGSNELKNITILIVRVSHSADVEQLISKSNCNKSINRQSLYVETLETEN